MTAPPLVLQAFRQPATVMSLDLAQWDVLVRQARRSNLLASLYAALDGDGLIDAIPAQAREHLAWSHAVAQRHRQAVRHEIVLIRQALEKSGVPIILLKGAAYVMANLPCADGRLFSDIDILVPKAQLDAVEAALMLHGWASTHHDTYDQRYYRTWMHELPPMQHIRRMTSIDVHHAIVPVTAPVHPDPVKLLAAARNFDDEPNLQILSAPDMVLHSAVHLFHDGELDHGLRDLVDLHRLLQHFGKTAAFWPLLVERAIMLELTRPLFYALRYATIMLHTDVPPEIIDAARIGRPNRFILALMDRLLLRALLPDHSSCADWLSATARRMLYVRANWLRMPPLLLIRHLFHKAFFSSKPI